MFYPIVSDADDIRQRPADGDAEPDAGDAQRGGRQQVSQRNAGAQRGDGQHHRHPRLVDGAVVAVEQEEEADADVARALDAQVVDARRRNAGPRGTGLEVKILAVFR